MDLFGFMRSRDIDNMLNAYQEMVTLSLIILAKLEFNNYEYRQNVTRGSTIKLKEQQPRHDYSL